MKAVMDAWCYIIMAVPIVTNLNDVMLLGCTCDYSDRVDTDGSGSAVSVMAMHIVIMLFDYAEVYCHPTYM